MGSVDPGVEITIGRDGDDEVVLEVLADLLTKELGAITINTAHLSVSASVSVGKFLTSDIVAKLEELSPSAGARVGVPRLDGDAAGSMSRSDGEGRSKAHVVSARASAGSRKDEITCAYSGSVIEGAGVSADGIGGVGIEGPTIGKSCRIYEAGGAARSKGEEE